jgi:tetrahydromethanopterin S-methyltransferase subunit G
VTDVFLGISAVSVLAMAIGLVAAVVVAARTVRRVGDRLGQLEETIRPIVANVQRISDDAARATAVATAQVERAEQIMDDVARRVDETMSAVQDTILGPARRGFAIFGTLRDVLGAVFDRGSRHSRSRSYGPSRAAAEDDASFIG